MFQYSKIRKSKNLRTSDGKTLLVNTDIYKDHLEKLKAQMILHNEENAYAHRISAFYAVKNYKKFYRSEDHMCLLAQEEGSYENFQITDGTHELLMAQMITSTDDGSKSLACQHTRRVFDMSFEKLQTYLDNSISYMQFFIQCMYHWLDIIKLQKLLTDSKMSIDTCEILSKLLATTTDAHEKLRINAEITKQIESSAIYDEHLKTFRYIITLKSRDYIRNLTIAAYYSITTYGKIVPYHQQYLDLVHTGEIIPYHKQYVDPFDSEIESTPSISEFIELEYEHYMRVIPICTDPGNRALALEHTCKVLDL